MKEETSRVCILGPGGMGKTSVSLAVVEQPLIKKRFLPENCIWVPCIEARSATLLLEILYIQLRVPGNKQVTIERIISLLNASTQHQENDISLTALIWSYYDLAPYTVLKYLLWSDSFLL